MGHTKRALLLVISGVVRLSGPVGEMSPEGPGSPVLVAEDPIDDRQQGGELVPGRSRIPGRPV